MTRRLAREEGLLVGGSCGMAVVAAAGWRPRPARTTWSSCSCPTAAAATCPRSSTTTGWPTTASSTSCRANRGRRSCCKQQGEDASPSWCTCTRTRRSSSAIDILREYGVSQLPVVRAEPPVTAAEVVGSVDERDLLDPLVTGHGACPTTRSRSTCRRRCRSSARASRCPRSSTRSRGRRGASCTTTASPTGWSPARTSSATWPAAAGPMSDAFETLAIHAGQEPDPATGAVVVPVHLTSTYAQDGVGGLRGGYEYSRSANPTRDRARGLPRRARGGHGRAGLRLGHGGRGHPAAHRAAGRATTSSSRPTPTAAPTGSSRGCSSGGASRWSVRRPRRPRRGAAGLRRRHRGGVVRDADQPAARHRRHRRPGRGRPRRRARCSSSTTPSPRRTSSSRWPSAPTSSSTRRPSTSAATPTWSAARWSSRTPSSASGCATTRTRWARWPARSTRGWCCAASRRSRVRMDRHCDNAAAVVELLPDHPTVAEVLYPGLPGPPGPRAGGPPDAAARRHGQLPAARPARRPLGRSASGPGCSRWPSRSAGWSRSSSTRRR